MILIVIGYQNDDFSEKGVKFIFFDHKVVGDQHIYSKYDVSSSHYGQKSGFCLFFL